MKNNQTKKGEIIIYKTKSGEMSLDVKFEKETIWLTQKQIATLFDVNIPAISKHIKNIYKEKELDIKSTVSKMETVQVEGSRSINRVVDMYNLDMIIAVGYRVNSKRATDFRIWATKTLKNYITSGYILNQKRIKELKDNELNEFKEAVGLIKKTIETKQISSDETKGLLQVITDYANTWATLQQYDEDKLQTQKTAKVKNILDYNVSHEAISTLKDNLIKKKEASDLFGRERDEALKGILGNINQSFGGKELYSSIEEKASHLLYFIIKNHPFTDGNKRIGSLLFILFLARNKYLFNKKGEKKFSDNALVALALLVAESDPKQKSIIIKLIINFIAN
jgi:death-on-curing family protein